LDIGLGTMGEPMALNLIRANIPLVVWNRTSAKCRSLAEARALVATHEQEVFGRCECVVLMLVDGAAMDEVLMRGHPVFVERVRNHTLSNMATTTPAHSRDLEADVPRSLDFVS
jgi:3-hydroxyisobutyrate dehydrogenase